MMKEIEGVDWKLSAIPLIYVALLLVLPSVEKPFVWGANHLRYHSSWVWAVCCVVLVGSSLPAVRERLLAIKFPTLSDRLQYTSTLR